MFIHTEEFGCSSNTSNLHKEYEYGFGNKAKYTKING
jgi:hypothetical protein